LLVEIWIEGNPMTPEGVNLELDLANLGRAIEAVSVPIAANLLGGAST
jgi:hypothetical protein